MRVRTPSSYRQFRKRFIGLIAGALLLSEVGTTASASDEIHPDLIRRVELQWEPVERAESYQLQLGTSPEFESPLYDIKTAETRYTFELLPGAYFYRVRGVDPRDREGRWTRVEPLNINARPPILLYPDNGEIIDGNLPDTGIMVEWRTSGPGIRYLIEIKATDDFGGFTKTVVKQEVDGTVYAFFPQEVGKYEWSVHTLGAGGDEPGIPYRFEVLGSIPPGRDRKIVRFVPPWWRGHWTVFARYSQSSLSYTIIDQDLRATGTFTGFTGTLGTDIYWKWHDRVPWALGGVPWVGVTYELSRQAVLSESVVLNKRYVMVGAWYAGLISGFQFTPLVEYGTREIAIYQPRTPTEATRSVSARSHLGLGLDGNYKIWPFFAVGVRALWAMDSGGKSGFAPVIGSGDTLDLNSRPGTLKSSNSLDLRAYSIINLGQRLLLHGAVGFETITSGWSPIFPTLMSSGIPPGDSAFTISNVTFDVSMGYRL